MIADGLGQLGVGAAAEDDDVTDHAEMARGVVAVVKDEGPRASGLDCQVKGRALRAWAEEGYDVRGRC